MEDYVGGSCGGLCSQVGLRGYLGIAEHPPECLTLQHTLCTRVRGKGHFLKLATVSNDQVTAKIYLYVDAALIWGTVQ
jgi:hypothetical protein